jgi:uncharacterized membrane protein YphA (DoxX/SURF4 family)
MNAWFYRWLETHAPAATLVIRLLAGLVFFLEGIKKFLFPAEWGVGRFEKIGIWHPALSAPFIGAVETVCGLRTPDAPWVTLGGRGTRMSRF